MAEQTQMLAETLGGGSEAALRSGGSGGGSNKSRAKERHPEKLDRDVDYATFLRWKKSWNMYVGNDQLDTLDEP